MAPRSTIRKLPDKFGYEAGLHPGVGSTKSLTTDTIPDDERPTFPGTLVDTIAIVGVGLIGGSIGLAARQRGLAKEIVGIVRRDETIQEAIQLGAITRGTTSIADGVADAELVVVCTPVALIADHVLQAAAACQSGTVITDAGSTKAGIIHAIGNGLADGVEFVGGHPLAGSHRSGVSAASADIYDDCVTLITPTRHSSPAAIARVENFWQGLGSRTIPIAAEKHDGVLAITSHLPHVVAASLAATTPSEYLDCTAGGWRDCTRIAAADCKLWEEILLANAELTIAAIDQFELQLQEFKQALKTRDADALTKSLSKGKQHRDALGS